jgi:hypothetical protein
MICPALGDLPVLACLLVAASYQAPGGGGNLSCPAGRGFRAVCGPNRGVDRRQPAGRIVQLAAF